MVVMGRRGSENSDSVQRAPVHTPLGRVVLRAPVKCERTTKNKERKKTENPRQAREGWEDGTPPPHSGILRTGVW